MPAPVLEDVDQRVSYLARPECPRVVPLTPHASPPAEGLVDPLRESDGESLEAPRECRAAVGLDDHVEVVGLHGEVKHAEAASRALCQASAKDRKEQISPQGGQGTPGSKGHVQRMPGDVLRSRPVGDTDLPARGLPSGTGAAAAPGARAELELDRACHLDWGRYVSLLDCCQAGPSSRCCPARGVRLLGGEDASRPDAADAVQGATGRDTRAPA